MPRKTRQQYNAIVTKAINNNNCSHHRQPITMINLTNFKLYCNQCRYPAQQTVSVQQLITNPIQAVIVHKNNGQYKHAHLLRKQLKEADQYMQVKVGFEILITAIEDQLKTYINRLRQQFNNQWNTAFADNANILIQIAEVQRRYKAVFDQVLENKFINGTTQQLQEVLKQFCNQRCEDPTSYLQQRVKNINVSTADMPIVDWQHLKHIHQIVCDPSLWTISKSIKPSFNEQSKSKGQQHQFKNTSLILPGIATALQKQNYWLLATQSKLVLMESLNENQNQQQQQGCDDSLSICIGNKDKNVQNKDIIDQLNVCNDAYYELDKCRIIGTNYSGITLYSYCLGHIVQMKHYPITGCQNLLAFQNTLILQAQGRILRLWLNDGFKQVVGLAGTNLKYTNNDNQFTYVNGKGDIVTRFAFHNQL